MKHKSAEKAAKWRVLWKTLIGGKKQGVEVVEIDNGRMGLRICPTRGMGILSATCDGVRLGWDSPVGEVVHPRFVNLRKKGGTGWLDGFTELVVRCGLNSIGRPGWDRSLAKNGKRSEFLTLHGRIANRKARHIRLSCDSSDKLKLSGVVTESLSPGGVLELATEISTRRNSRSFRIRDAITNRSARPVELQVLYHSNIGAPLLASGARFLAAVDAVAGIDRHAAQYASTLFTYGPPSPGFKEQVFLLSLRADRSGRSIVALRSPAGDAAISIEFSIAELPFMTLWKQTGLAEEMYVTGLEPGTSFPNHRSVERRHGRVMTLSPNTCHYVTLKYTFHYGVPAVRRLQKRITAIQGNKRPKVLSLRHFYMRQKTLSPGF